MLVICERMIFVFNVHVFFVYFVGMIKMTKNIEFATVEIDKYYF